MRVLCFYAPQQVAVPDFFHLQGLGSGVWGLLELTAYSQVDMQSTLESQGTRAHHIGAPKFCRSFEIGGTPNLAPGFHDMISNPQIQTIFAPVLMKFEHFSSCTYPFPLFVPPCPALPYPTQPCPSLPYLTLPYPTVPYPALPCLTFPYPTLPYPTLPCPTLPYPTLSYPTPPHPTPTLPSPSLPYPALPFPALPNQCLDRTCVRCSMP